MLNSEESKSTRSYTQTEISTDNQAKNLGSSHFPPRYIYIY